MLAPPSAGSALGNRRLPDIPDPHGFQRSSELTGSPVRRNILILVVRLTERYPTVAREQLEKDVTNYLEVLQNAGIIERVSR